MTRRMWIVIIAVVVLLVVLAAVVLVGYADTGEPGDGESSWKESAALGASAFVAPADQRTSDRRTCRRGPRVCRVLRHHTRMANAAHRKPSTRFPVDGYSRNERRTIRRKHLNGVTPRHYFARPHRRLGCDSCRDVQLAERTWTSNRGARCKSVSHGPVTVESVLGLDLWRFESRFEWCWRKGRVTRHEGNLSTISVNDFYINLGGVKENNDHFVVGSGRTTFVFDRLYQAENCAFKYGCYRWLYPKYEVVVGTRGRWTGDFWWA